MADPAPTCPECGGEYGWPNQVERGWPLRWVKCRNSFHSPSVQDASGSSPPELQRADERKWTKAFNRLEKAVQRHIDAKGWTDNADDALHAAHRRIMRDVGPFGGGDPSVSDAAVEALRLGRETPSLLDEVSWFLRDYARELDSSPHPRLDGLRRDVDSARAALSETRDGE